MNDGKINAKLHITKTDTPITLSSILNDSCGCIVVFALSHSVCLFRFLTFLYLFLFFLPVSTPVVMYVFYCLLSMCCLNCLSVLNCQMNKYKEFDCKYNVYICCYVGYKLCEFADSTLNTATTKKMNECRIDSRQTMNRFDLKSQISETNCDNSTNQLSK